LTVDTLDFFGLIRVLGSDGKEVDGELGGFDLLGNVDQLTETRDTERDVLGTDTSKMEGTKGHLSGRLTDGLSGNGSDRFARMDEGAHELGLDVAHKPIKGLLVEAVLDKDRLGRQGRPDHDLEKEGRVLLRLHGETVLSWHDEDVLAQLAHLPDNVRGVEVARLALVDLEQLDGTFDGLFAKKKKKKKKVIKNN